ncbi:MAG: HAD-IIIA family hydrolase [Lentimicrobium sp.]|nr:HAD-IIIA family hydrolase [Lentimicrobium sp.]
MKLANLKINKDWTLFLDRDGVINNRLLGAYVVSPDEFTFIEGVPEAISLLSKMFGIIVVVTNQQGIGKGLMTAEDLNAIHLKMLNELSNNGGRIDRVYHSPYLESSGHFTRKPAIGMALKAKKDFQEIKFTKSVMVGDSISDMIFGKRLKMCTVFIGDVGIARRKPLLVDFIYPDLLTFAREISLKSSDA